MTDGVTPESGESPVQKPPEDPSEVPSVDPRLTENPREVLEGMANSGAASDVTREEGVDSDPDPSAEKVISDAQGEQNKTPEAEVFDSLVKEIRESQDPSVCLKNYLEARTRMPAGVLDFQYEVARKMMDLGDTEKAMQFTVLFETGIQNENMVRANREHGERMEWAAGKNDMAAKRMEDNIETQKAIARRFEDASETMRYSSTKSEQTAQRMEDVVQGHQSVIARFEDASYRIDNASHRFDR